MSLPPTRRTRSATTTTNTANHHHTSAYQHQVERHAPGKMAQYPFIGKYKVDDEVSHGWGGIKRHGPSTQMQMRITGKDICIERIDVPAMDSINCAVRGPTPGARLLPFVYQGGQINFPTDGPYTLHTTVRKEKGSCQHHLQLNVEVNRDEAQQTLAAPVTETRVIERYRDAPLYISNGGIATPLLVEIDDHGPQPFGTTVAVPPDCRALRIYEDPHHQRQPSPTKQDMMHPAPVMMTVPSVETGIAPLTDQTTVVTAKADKPCRIVLRSMTNGEASFGEMYCTLQVPATMAHTVQMTIDTDDGFHQKQTMAVPVVSRGAPVAPPPPPPALAPFDVNLRDVKGPDGTPNRRSAYITAPKKDSETGAAANNNNLIGEISPDGVQWFSDKAGVDFPGVDGIHLRVGDALSKEVLAQMRINFPSSSGANDRQQREPDPNPDWLLDLAAALKSPTHEGMQQRLGKITPPTQEAGSIIDGIRRLINSRRLNLKAKISQTHIEDVTCDGYRVFADTGDGSKAWPSMSDIPFPASSSSRPVMLKFYDDESSEPVQIELINGYRSAPTPPVESVKTDRSPSPPPPPPAQTNDVSPDILLNHRFVNDLAQTMTDHPLPYLPKTRTALNRVLRDTPNASLVMQWLLALCDEIEGLNEKLKKAKDAAAAIKAPHVDYKFRPGREQGTTEVIIDGPSVGGYTLTPIVDGERRGSAPSGKATLLLDGNRPHLIRVEMRRRCDTNNDDDASSATSNPGEGKLVFEQTLTIPRLTVPPLQLSFENSIIRAESDRGTFVTVALDDARPAIVKGPLKLNPTTPHSMAVAYHVLEDTSSGNSSGTMSFGGGGMATPPSTKIVEFALHLPTAIDPRELLEIVQALQSYRPDGDSDAAPAVARGLITRLMHIGARATTPYVEQLCVLIAQRVLDRLAGDHLSAYFQQVAEEMRNMAEKRAHILHFRLRGDDR